MLAVVVLAAILVQSLSETNTDVSWLLTLGERWLAGDRPYVDFVEVNPPASLLLYMPAIFASRWFGLSPEAATITFALVGSVASAILTVRLLASASLVPAAREQAMVLVLTGLLTIIPTGDFGEREHIATVTMLPLLAALAARSVALPASLSMAVLAGVGGGVAIAIKPMFGLALIGPAFVLLAGRGWRETMASAELHAAWIIPAVYSLLVVLAFPAFTQDVLHRVLVAYVPFHQPWLVFALQPITFVACGFAGLALLVRRPPIWSTMLLLAALGFEVAFFWQGKAWVYQALPAVLLSAAALSGELLNAEGGPGRRRRWLTAAGAALAVWSALSFARHPTIGAAVPGLAAAIESERPHPTMLALSSDIAVGHPLVRDVGGRWVGTFPSQWISRNAERLLAQGVSPETGAELDRLSRQEQSAVAQDLASKRPDVVLIDGPRGERYVAEHPAIAAEMSAYEQRGAFGPIALWVRR